MDIICKVLVPATIVFDMGSEEVTLEKTITFKEPPYIGLKLRENTLRMAMCRNEKDPIFVEDLLFDMKNTSYIVRTNRLWIGGTYLNRLDGWDTEYHENARNPTHGNRSRSSHPDEELVN